jgi:RNA polymerase sigma-70 factor, ECF subfamily
MSRPRSGDRQARFRSMLEAHAKFVERTLRNAGVPRSDLDDEVQRTFMVAARRLDDLQLDAERQFLFQVALNVAAHARRTLARRREVSGDHAPESIETLATPEHFAERSRMREKVEGILARMNQSLRAVLVLFAFEDMTTTEIAAALRVPRGTVASRLRRARKQFREHAEAINLAPPGNDVARDERVSWRRDSSSALELSLLRAGLSSRPSAAMRTKTLVALGLVALAPPSRAGAPRPRLPGRDAG